MNNITPNQISIPAFTPPGSGAYGRNMAAQMLSFGAEIRDRLIWLYPLLPGAVYTYCQMASEREWKVTGKPRSVARAIEWFNNAQTLDPTNGLVDYGFEQFLRRRSLDYIAVGRTAYTWGKQGEPLRYLDPTAMTYYLEDRQWVDNFTQEKFPVDRVVVNHAIPIGASGSFISPLASVIPTAQLAWLVREHDKAAADGRKLRDIFIVGSTDLGEAMGQAVVQTLKLWSGADPVTEGIPIVDIDLLPGMKASDLIHRIGLANIPENFNRDSFQFAYVNDTANALGLATRYIWNSEKATNRALEEVQEARMALKGPAGFVRCEQRLYTRSGLLDQFGPDETRFGFIEQVDMASTEINAKVLKLYAEAFEIFIKNLGGVVNADALVAWLQRDDILPADLDIITDFVQINSENPPTPVDGKIQRNSDASTPVQKAAEDVIQEGEITMTGDGKIVERRNKVFSIQKAILAEIAQDATLQIEKSAAFEREKTISFKGAVEKARAKNLARFKAIMAEESVDDPIILAIYQHVDKIEEDDHRLIQSFLKSRSA